MTSCRKDPPHITRDPFLADVGIETTLYSYKSLRFPDMAVFTSLRDLADATLLRACFAEYAKVAVDRGVGLILGASTFAPCHRSGGTLRHRPPAR